MHAKLAAERELSEKTMVALDDHNRQLRETRAALQASEADVEILKAKLSRQQDTGKRARRSRQNRYHCYKSKSDMTFVHARPFDRGRDRAAHGP